MKIREMARDIHDALEAANDGNGYQSVYCEGSDTCLDGEYDLEKVVEILVKKWEIFGRTDP